MVNIQADIRNKGNTDKLRAEGKIPAVFYGAKSETTSISIDQKAFDKVLKEAGESSTIGLSVDGKKLDVLIHEVQYDPIRNIPSHVDFLVVDMNKPIRVQVALSFDGVAPAVKNNLGILVKVLHEVEVEALPKDLPHEISVNLESLENADSHINAGSLVMPKGVTLVTDENEVVASIAVQKEEAEEPSPSADLSSIEVEKKGKKEEEGEVESA